MVFNSIVIDDVVFDKNSAGWGGALAFISSRSKNLAKLMYYSLLIAPGLETGLLLEMEKHH